MTQDKPISFTIRLFEAFASLGILLFFMIQARTIINALFISYIIVLSASPLLYWLTKKKAPAWLAFAFTLLAIILIFGFLLVLLIVAFNRLVDSFPTYSNELQSIVDDIDQSLVDLGVEEGDIDGLFADLAHLFEPSKVFDAAIAFIDGIVSAFSNIALVGLILVFLLVDAFGIAKKLSSEIKSGNDYIKRVTAFGADIRQYVYITTVVGIVTGIGDVIFFLIFGSGLRCSLGNLSLSTELYSHHRLLAGGHPTDDIDLVGIWLVKSSNRLPGDSHHQWFRRKCC